MRLWTLVLDISVTMAQFPSKEIARRSYDYRTLGLGYANLGGLLMSSGIAYDSGQGRALCAAISAMMTAEAYHTSAQMARDLGSFEGHPANAKAMRGVLANHARAACGENSGYHNLSTPPVPLDIKALGTSTIPERIKAIWEQALAMGDWHGYRNAQVTRHRPDRHDWPPHGLRHDGNRTGFRARQIQEARWRRLFQNHQPGRSGGIARPWIHAAPDRRYCPLRRRPWELSGRSSYQSQKPPRKWIHQDENCRNRE